MDNQYNGNDTIAAISTPPGANGIGIIRISGDLSLVIADRIFRAKDSKRLSDAETHSLHYGHIHEGSRDVDEVLVSVMRKPSTYTREDIVEINCHSSVACLKQILTLVLDAGARMAGPGEFTKRAFLNGRIDLVQAEAVCDIIASSTREGLDIAQRQLGGDVSQKIKSTRRYLIDSAAEIEACINFPEEGLQVYDLSLIQKSLETALRDILEIIDSSEKGIIFRQGLKAVICGRPNVGKSSLMNSLLRHDRVIVSHAAGTTRDTIEETVNIKGIPLTIIDTAGIMQSEDHVVKESVTRSMDYLGSAALVLLVMDASQPLSEDDMCLIGKMQKQKVLFVLNKSDLPGRLDTNTLKGYLEQDSIINISAKYGTGLDRLEQALYNMVFSSGVSTDDIRLSNTRHIESAKKALGFIRSALKGLNEKRPDELISIDIRDAADALGLITGEIFTQDMLDNIFSRFCVGK